MKYLESQAIDYALMFGGISTKRQMDINFCVHSI